MRFVCFFLIACSCAGQLFADDWPQWMGPSRDNVWREAGIIEEFPSDGPDVLWRMPVAGGYSGPAVADGLLVVTDYVTDDNVKVDNFARKKFTGTERVLAMDAQSGELRWKHELPVDYTISYPAGPRCTPIIHDGFVYTLGAEGHLFCFNAKTGDVVWSKSFQQEFTTKVPLWGYAAHPLIDGEKLICIVGGQDTHCVAFDRASGAKVWTVLTAKEQGYSPPTIVTAMGKRQLILVRPDGVSSVDPDSGKVHWTAPYEATNGSVIMSPLLFNNHLYVGGYSNKNMLLKLTNNEAGYEVVWKNLRKKAISPVNVQPILDGSILYGMDQAGEMLAMDVMTGERLWATAWPLGKRRLQTGSAFLVRHEDEYWMFTEQGDLVIARLNKDGHEEVSRANLLEPTGTAFGRAVVWSAPAYANKRVYLRNDKECICVDLARR